MDTPIIVTPTPDNELQVLIDEAHAVYTAHFSSDAWFGRCIFLSWYCDRGTCTFCFRSVTKHKIEHPEKARRSLASVLAEAMLIKGLGWRIEFLTGGYGICNDEELVRFVKLVSEILDEKIWVNLGEIGTELLEEFKPYVKGIVSSIETVESNLHTTVCPDKPIQPYVDMMKKAKVMGFELGMTIVLGLGEKKEDFLELQQFIEKNQITRITIYALRPVKGTPFEHGPDPLDVAWWVAKTRIAFPNIEIIVGSAHYRIPELSLHLTAGANAITKLPASNIFNTKQGRAVEDEVKKANRNFVSHFTHKNVHELADWEEMLSRVDLTPEEREAVRENLYLYLDKMAKHGKTFFKADNLDDSCLL